MFIKNVLKDIVELLERKFPDKIEITMQEYKELREEVSQLNKYIQGAMQLQTRLEALQKDLDLVKSNLGYLGTRNQIKPLER